MLYIYIRIIISVHALYLSEARMYLIGPEATRWTHALRALPHARGAHVGALRHATKRE